MAHKNELNSMTKEPTTPVEELAARSRKRASSLGVLAVDAAGRVVEQHGPDLGLLSPSRSAEDSERNFAALWEILACFYAEVRDEVSMRRTVVRTGKR
jgi:hypothetical protein